MTEERDDFVPVWERNVHWEVDRDTRQMQKHNPNTVPLEELAENVGLSEAETRRIIIKMQHKFTYERGRTPGTVVPR